MDDRSKVLKFGGFRWDGVPAREYKTGNVPYRDVTRQTLLGEGAGEEPFSFVTRYFEIQPGGYSTLERHRHPHAVVVIRGRGRVTLGDKSYEIAPFDCVYVSPGGDRVTFQSVNPATGEVLETFGETAPDALTGILERADLASRDWRRRPVTERAERLRAAGRVLRERKEAYARTMALEMGKPLAQGAGEAEKCAWVCDYYAEHGPALLADEPRPSDASRSYIRFEALGPVLAIMPWNFPFWQVFRFAAPALVAGNAGILKHAPNVPRCAVEIEDVFRDAGFPDGLFRAVFLSNEGAGSAIADGRVRAVTLTGSDRAGSQVAEQAGRHLKKTVLELGGSDPFLVLDDADLERAARTAAEARLINSGQSCIAAKRFIVVERVADQFLELFTSEMRSRKVGDPLDPTTQVGP